MIDPANVPEVTAEEWLARYVCQSKHVRLDKTVRPDAFIPYPHKDLSVTRHLLATEQEIWSLGEQVAKSRGSLAGRADIQASTCHAENLGVVAAPIPENPNHADVTGWPAEKSLQKMIAVLLASKAAYRQRP